MAEEKIETKEEVTIAKTAAPKAKDDGSKAALDALRKESESDDVYEKPFAISDSDFEETVKFGDDIIASSDEASGDATITMAGPVERPKAKPIDPESVKKTVARNELDIESDLKRALFTGKSAFQIVAAQSGYIAKIAPLVNRDFVDLYNSSLSSFESRKLIFSIIYEKIIESSAGKMSFNDWLSSTSVGDLETFYYGLYCSTFGDEGIATMECPNCGESFQFTLNCRNLAKTADKDKMKERLDDVSKNANSAEDMRKFSLLSEKKTYSLPKSGILVELHMPSLYDMLAFLRTTPEKVAQAKSQNPAYISTVLSISKVSIPMHDQSGLYTDVADSQKFIRIIDQLDIDDANALNDVVADMIENYHITYSVKGLSCPKCHKAIGDVPVNIEQILFTQIFRKI
jgi:hypothetical protein